MESSELKTSMDGVSRCHYIDWLRVFGMLVVFYFHNAHIFDMIGEWQIKNQQLSFGLTISNVFTSIWIMPLFFMLAGAGSRFALGVRSSKVFIVERFKRLMIPYFFGILIIVPPQKYIENIRRFDFHGSYIEFYGELLKQARFYFDSELLGYYGYHLWFLAFLFIFSLLALPLFRYFAAAKGEKWILRAASVAQRPWGLFLLAVPIMLINMALRPLYPVLYSWADFFFWFILFIYGYMLLSDKSFTEILERNRIKALVVGIACTGAIGAAYISGYLIKWAESPAYTIDYMVYQVIYSLDVWAWVIFFMASGAKYLNFSTPFIKYANEGALPFYILHQTVIIMIGFYVIQWSMGIPAKFLIISTVSLILTVGIYGLLVRPIGLLRFLFGLRSQKR